ncbi:peptidase [candidate division KSB1 bacterium]|nr:peptidase [candidate division KSB1 bacterium]
MTRVLFFMMCCVLLLKISGCSKKVIESVADPREVKAQVDKFAPVVIQYDTTILDENETAALHKIVEAAIIMDEIFLHQVYAENPAIREALMKSTDLELVPHKQLFNIMFGPFNRLENDKPFINKNLKPDGANFYPEDMTKEEFISWITDHPEDKESFEHVFTKIERQGDSLSAIPYSEAYKEWLEPAATLLKEAAHLTKNESLKRYLTSRAAAFLSNDYYQSDMDWMDLDSQIEVVIGPYEVYEDKMFNYKASFESFVTIVDPAESKKLAVVAKHLKELEKALPYAEKYKNFERGSESPVKVVQEVFSAGDTKAGVQTLAFNLPNDERVREAKGSKKVMLKNIAHAKFDKIYMPIANIVLAADMLELLSFDGWYTHILMHEVTHGLGPGMLKQEDGSSVPASKLLKETYSAIEECKADVGGMYTFAYLCKKGIFPVSQEKGIYPTYLAGIFRSVRFGADEAHGIANMIAFNYILEQGGFEYIGEIEKFKVNDKKIRDAVSNLLNNLLSIEATGNYDAAIELINNYGAMPENMKTVIAKLANVPVDIRPEFEIIGTLQ